MEEDENYAGPCAEFPSFSWLDESSEAALSSIRQLAADVAADLEADNEPVQDS